MKDCCLDTWYETNVVIRMITWEIMRKEPGGDARWSQDQLFPISYTCYKCKTKWNSRTQPYPIFERASDMERQSTELRDQILKDLALYDSLPAWLKGKRK